MKIGSTVEYILMGMFNIDDIEKTDYTTKFSCYDNMIKFETAYFSSLGDKATLQQVVNELSSKTGVQFIGSLPAYTVSKLDGFTCREVLSYVASICGGNAIITRDGEFTIKTLSEVEKAIDGNNYFEYKREEIKYKVGQISCQVDENNILSKGSLGTDSMELQFENPWINSTILTDIYNKLNGLSYLGYSMKWQGDVSLDPYDIITVTDVKNVVRKVPILSQKFTYTGGLTSETGAKGETKNKNSFSSSGSTTNKVNRLVTEQAVIKEALIEKANISDLKATNAEIANLKAKDAEIENTIINKANIEDLKAINASIENLIAADANITNLISTKANITDLTATNIKFNVGSGGTLDLQTLLAKHITGENGQFLNITSSNTVIANAIIKDAMIENISVNKLLAGTISTNKFTVASDDGGINIVGTTMQFKDKNNKVRIQMGQDTQGSFNFILRGEDGTTTLIDHTGIKEKAIADKLIKSNMVADNAIGEQQINYSSLVTGINKDTNTNLIKASKVAIDLTGQSLEVSFNNLKSNVDGIEIGGRNLLKLSSFNTPSYETSLVKKSQSTVAIAFGVGNDLYESGEYIISFLIKSKFTNGRAASSVRLSQADENSNNFASIAYIGRGRTESDVWSKVLYNLTLTSKKRLGLQIYNHEFLTDFDSEVYVKNIKIEKGNKATDWTPAPEDIDSKIESNTTSISVVQGKIDALISENSIIKSDVTTISDKYTSLKATVDGINTTVASHTSSIGTINTNLSVLSGKITTVENNYSSLSQDLSGFKTTVSNTYSTKTELNGVDGKVNSLTNRVSTAESNITQLNNQIKLKVEATDITEAINNVQIGGRNFITPSKVSAYTPYSTVVSNNYNGWTVTKANYSNNLVALSQVGYTPEVGKTYTMSGYAEVNGTPITEDFFPTKKINTYMSVFGTFEVNAGYFKITQKWTTSIIWLFHTNFNVKTGDVIVFKNLKWEEGNKATDWSPNPNDIDSSITTVANKVSTLETNLNFITQRVSSTETTVSTINGNVTNLTSRVSTAESKLTATSLTTTISSAISGGTSSITTTQFVMDSTGFTVKNGAIKIQNKAGQTVLSGDTNGNLTLTGSINVNTQNAQQLFVNTNDSKLPVLVSQAKGTFTRSLAVSNEYLAWSNDNAWSGVNITPSGISTPSLSATGDISANGWITGGIVHAISNGQGTNFRIGDDCWLGDINEYATVKLQCTDNTGTGYLRFGNGAKIGYGGGAPLDVHGSLWVTENIFSYGGLSIDNTYTDRCDNSPWYGIGRASIGLNSSQRCVQVAGYYGLRLRADAALIDINYGSYNMLCRGHWMPYDTRSYWLGTNSPDKQWKGLCAEGGVVGASDIRSKENIERLDGSIVTYDEISKEVIEYQLATFKSNTRASRLDYYEFIKDRFKPTYYNYKLSDLIIESTGEYSLNPEDEYNMLKNVGFIAQDYDLETDKVAQEFIFKNEDGTLSYNHMSYVTVGMIALQEAIQKIDTLEKEKEELKNEINEIKKHLGLIA